MNEQSDKPVAIIGGGPAGLAVAHGLAQNNIRSILVEKDDSVGGWARRWPCLATDRCMRCFSCLVADLKEEVEQSGMVDIRLNCNCRKIEEQAGEFLLNCHNGSSSEPVQVSKIVLSTGFEPYDPTEKGFWGYGQLKGVLTSKDLGLMLAANDLSALIGDSKQPLNVAFFQCVGSRDSSIGANYCSTYCCKNALRTALKLLDIFPDWGISVFYIDLQTPGKMASSLIGEARAKGVRLLQGVPGEINMGPENSLEIIREEKGRNIRERFDRIILSIGQRPRPPQDPDDEIIGIRSSDTGHISTPNPIDPCRSATSGIYVAGACQGPRDIEMTIEHAGQTVAAIIQDLTMVKGA